MLYRTLRKVDTGQWLNVLFTTAGDSFSIPPATHQHEIAAAFGLPDASFHVIDNPTDPRSGALLALPSPPIVPTLLEQLGLLAQPMLDQIEAIINARNLAQPITVSEKLALKQKLLHLISGGQLPG